MSKSNMAIVLVSTLVGAVFYHAITNVNDGDVAAYNHVPQQMQGFLVKAGDIVAVTRDGSNPESICPTSAGQDYDVEATNAVYVNELAKHLPTFTGLIGLVTGVLGFGDSESQPDSVRFAGRIIQTKEPDSAEVSAECSCEIARRLARNELVCTTRAAMIAIGANFAQAVRFARYSNIVTDPSTFEKCGVKPVDFGPAVPRCDQFGQVPWDASLRRLLNVVERQEVRDGPVAGLRERTLGSL